MITRTIGIFLFVLLSSTVRSAFMRVYLFFHEVLANNVTSIMSLNLYYLMYITDLFFLSIDLVNFSIPILNVICVNWVLSEEM